MKETRYQDHTCTTMSGETEAPGNTSCPTSSIAKCKKIYIADNFLTHPRNNAAAEKTDDVTQCNIYINTWHEVYSVVNQALI